MAKQATEYFQASPWEIVEEGFDPERNRVAESVFSLGNEYMGVRGFAEEGIACGTLRGCYFNGIYEYATEDTPSAYRGIVKRTHFMINSVNWLDASVELDGERLDTARCKIADFRRTLDMRTGVLTRAFVWETASGKRVRAVFTRFLSMTECTRGYQRMAFTPLNFSGTLSVTAGLDQNAVQWGERCFWEPVLSRADKACAGLLAKTPTTGQQLASCCVVEAEDAKQPYVSEMRAGYCIKLKLERGKAAKVTKYAVNLVEKRAVTSPEELLARAAEQAAASARAGFDSALRDAAAYWEGVWKQADIEISGDDKNQQGIRFCIFQLQQTYHGYAPENNIGAKGLTGEAYSGHAFWDTETYCLPYYLFHNQEAAKNLLLFRYRTLAEAKARAAELDCAGACYPVATLNGKEGCSLWQHASLQFQPSTGVAYGIWHYERVTGDEGFLRDYGLEMLLEIGRFLLSRGQWNAGHTKFGYYCVMGPDEFQMMVNHNCYTNYMAKRALEYALEAARRFPAEAQRLGFTQAERAAFTEAAEKMYLPYDAKRCLFEQHEGFFDLPHIDVDRIPVEEFPLYSHWSYDRIYRNDMIKQPDVLMFLFLYDQSFTEQQKRAAYLYYEPRCIHESSLSPSVHSILAAELGYGQEALEFFGFATRMDLDDYNRNTSEGLHTTSIAAAWMNIVYGFGGLRSDGEALSLAPQLPEIWEGYSFRLRVRGVLLTCRVGKESVKLTAEGEAEFPLRVYGKEYRFTGDLEVPLCAR